MSYLTRIFGNMDDFTGFVADLFLTRQPLKERKFNNIRILACLLANTIVLKSSAIAAALLLVSVSDSTDSFHGSYYILSMA